MTIRNIMLVATGNERERAAVVAAFRFTGHFNAHLEALFTRPSPQDTIPVVGEGMTGGIVGELMAAAAREGDERHQVARALYDEQRDATGMAETDAPVAGGEATTSCSFLDLTGREEELIARRGRLADLIIAARVPDHAAALMAFDAAMLETGRPLLVIPEGYALEKVPENIAIAWNGSLEGARAVASALPVLAEAKNVTIFTVVRGSNYADSADELVTSLAWRGINATLRTLDPDRRSVADRLMAEMAEHGHDLLVMGAYSHSRMREMILGGVTRGVVERTVKPVWFCH